MHSLVIIHAEMRYLRCLSPHRYEQLIGGISREIERYIQRDEDVYLLAHEPTSPESHLIPPEIREHLPCVTFIPRDVLGNGRIDSFYPQYLETKRLLIDGNYRKVELGGLARGACVEDVDLLLSRPRTLSKCLKHHYRNAARALGWTDRKFRKIFRCRINASVRNDLTY